MRATCLLFVLVLSKALTLAGRELPASVLAPLAYLWQDVAVAATFGVLDALLRRRRVMWLLYAALVVYAAVNVPVTRVLGTALTPPLLRATGGTLSDSILHYATAMNLATIVIVLAAAALLPRFVSSRASLLARPQLFVALPILALGPLVSDSLSTRGLHRTPIVVLLSGLRPRLDADHQPGDHRSSPFATDRVGTVLETFTGVAREFDVLIAVLESTGARHVGAFGSGTDAMPRLSRLARDALAFENAYCVYPESIKGMLSYLCSIEPALDLPVERQVARPVTSLAEVLEGHGYRTGLFHSGRFDYLGMRAAVEACGFETAEDAGSISGEVDSSFGVDDGATVDRLLGWLDEIPPKARFLAAYLPISGHHPYVRPDQGPFPGNADVDRYRNALEYSDRQLDRLLCGLKQRGRLEHTLVVIFGDHGEAFGEHEGNYGHTLQVYEENVHVPFLISAPAVLPPRRVSDVISLVDTAPTILDLLGIEAPETFQGRSALSGEPAMALMLTDYGLAWLALRDGPFKLIHLLEEDRSMLFRLDCDPGENDDVSRLHRDRVSAYREILIRWCQTRRATNKL